jgi:low temperature requirement protein LtrA
VGTPADDAEDDYAVKPLELFFDLVFVFALTQVTGLLAADPGWEQLARGLLVLAALWWAWAGYTWLTTTRDPSEGVVRLVLFAAMAAWLVAALAVPKAFSDDAVVFGVAYLAVRVAHVGTYYLAARGDRELTAAITRSLPFWITGPLLILAAGFLDGVAQGALWAAALLLDYGSGLLGRGGGWRLHAEHFAERHGLIVIVALGESIVAAGAGAADTELGAGTIAAAVLAFAVTGAIWWTYFDVAALVASRRLAARHGIEQARQARDSYSYIHLPMVAGVVLFAFGAKKTLGHHDEPLDDVAAAALAGGVALFLLAHVAFRLRNRGSLARLRLAVALALLAFAAVAPEFDALVALAVVTALAVGLVTVETATSVEARRRIRHASA